MNLITAAVQETYLDIVYSSRLRKSQSENSESLSETLTYYHRNVAKT